MALCLVGLSHKTAPVSMRERVAVDFDSAAPLLASIVADRAEEVAVLSTCNRTEFYAVAGDAQTGEAILMAAFERLAPSVGLGEVLYRRHDEDAARHLFTVAAGLDSLVLGEDQVLGQVRRAHETAVRAGTSGPVLAKLFTQGVRVGKRVRSETAISRGAASVSYAAVELARKIFDSLGDKKILLVGAGKMAELAAKNLCEQGTPHLYVANRTREKSEALASSVGGHAVPLDAVFDLLGEVDIVITSTGSRLPLIERAHVEKAMRARKGRPLFFIDIAVPRDVDPLVHEIEGVFLYNIDDLKAVVAANVAEREQCVAQAMRIVDQETRAFCTWLGQRQAAPIIRALRAKVKEAADQELQKTLRRLDHLPEREKEQVRALAHAIAGKILHQPTMQLKSSVAEGTHREFFQYISRLFGLDAGERAPGPERPREGSA